MSEVLWSSIVFKKNEDKLNKFNLIRSKFNDHFVKINNDDNIEKSVENNNDNDNDNENKIILEKINNYILALKDEKLDLNAINILEILKEEESICTYLCKYVLQNNFLNFDFFINSLTLLKEMSGFLRKNLQQKKFNHDLKKLKATNSIPRSSYKFCHFKDGCMYNYDKDKNGCYADHYVHNLVEADIEALIEYIKNNFSENIINHNKEIIKCINTLCFVIKHMTTELNSLCIYCEPCEYQNYHVNKIVKKSKKKKKKKKNSKKKSKNN